MMRTLRGKKRAEAEIGWTHTPRLAPGEYPAYCQDAWVYFDKQFKRWVCASQFDVLTSDRVTVLARLTWFLNLGSGGKPHVTRRRNYWPAWTLANGGPPARKDRLSPRVFRKRHAIVTVADTAKNFRQVPVMARDAYSVIRGVVRWETGRVER